MKVGTQVIAVSAGNPHMTDYSVLRQAVQVPVYGSVAYLRISCVDILIYLLCSRVVAP